MKALLLALTAFPVCLRAQTRIEGHWGKPYLDVAYSVAATDDGGYIMTGLSKQGLGDHVGDIVVIKTSATGDTMWTFQYGGPYLEGGNSVMQTADGGYMVSGHTEDFGARDCDAFLMKLSKKGEYQWLKVYGGDEDDISEDALELEDGSFVFAGITASYGNADNSDRRHVYIVKTDNTGNAIWTHYYAGAGAEYANSIAKAHDGGFFAAGFTKSFRNGGQDAWLLRFNAGGDTLWTDRYISGGASRYMKILPTNDNGYILCGYTMADNTAKSQGLIVKIDAEGKRQWERKYGDGNQGITFSSAAQMPNGNLIFTGTSFAKDSTGNMYNLTTDATGNKISDELIGGVNAHGVSVATQGNNGYIVVGASAKYGDPYDDLYYVQTNNTVTGIPPTELPAPKVYPNPFRDNCVVVLPASHANDMVSVRLLSVSGQTIFARDNVPAKNIVIPGKGLAAGQYFCDITCPDGKVYKAKVTVE